MGILTTELHGLAVARFVLLALVERDRLLSNHVQHDSIKRSSVMSLSHPVLPPPWDGDYSFQS